MGKRGCCSVELDNAVIMVCMKTLDEQIDELNHFMNGLNALHPGGGVTVSFDIGDKRDPQYISFNPSEFIDGSMLQQYMLSVCADRLCGLKLLRKYQTGDYL